MCLSSSKVWVRHLWRWQSNDCKTFKMANRGESFPQRKDTFSSRPSSPCDFLMSDVKCTPVTNITPQLSLGAGSVGRSGLGDSICPGPHTGSSQLGFQLAVPEKGRWWSRGESLSWQLLSQGWGKAYYTTLTFGVESSGKSKPTPVHRQLGKAGALMLCSPKTHREAIHR